MKNNLIIKTKILKTHDMYGNEEYILPNQSKVIYFNKKWILLNSNGVVFSDKYDLPNLAINRILSIYNYPLSFEINNN